MTKERPKMYSGKKGHKNLRVDREEELSLMRPDPGGRDPLDQLRMLIYQPSFAQDVGGRIFELQRERKRPLNLLNMLTDDRIKICHIYQNTDVNLLQFSLSGSCPF